jgi:hypothetical protein
MTRIAPFADGKIARKQKSAARWNAAGLSW